MNRQDITKTGQRIVDDRSHTSAQGTARELNVTDIATGGAQCSRRNSHKLERTSGIHWGIRSWAEKKEAKGSGWGGPRQVGGRA